MIPGHDREIDRYVRIYEKDIFHKEKIDSEKEREREREIESVCVCVCVKQWIGYILG